MVPLLRPALLLASLALSATVLPPSAEAKPARCFTSDDGYYPCEFEAFGGDGSFEIRAAGYPTFTLTMDGNGVAFASGIFEPGGRSVALPGLYRRERADPACWMNDTTGARLCAW